MRIEGTKKAYVEVDSDQMDDITARHLKTTYWDMIDDLTEQDIISFQTIYKFFSGADIDNLDRR
jgi:hypothetical protein